MSPRDPSEIAFRRAEIAFRRAEIALRHGSSQPGTDRARSRKRRRHGITLVELLIAMTLSVVLAMALGYAFAAGLTMRRLQAARSANLDSSSAMKSRITIMLSSAWLSPTTTDTTTFFIGNSASGQSVNSDMGCSTLTFTTTAPDVPLSSQNSDDDFETQLNANGPIGGIAEVDYSTTPVGDPGNRTGLFERIQRPSDGDPTQGGMESLLSADVQSIGFQFWDGLEWITAWDTTTGGATNHRLPAAVKISYTLKNSRDNAVQTFIVPIRTSDVTPLKPVSGMGGATP